MSYKSEIQATFAKYSSAEQNNYIPSIYQSFGSNNKAGKRGFSIGKDRRLSSNYAIIKREKLMYFSQLLTQQSIKSAREIADIGKNTALGLACVINKEARKRGLTDTYLQIKATIGSLVDEKLLEKILLNRYGQNGLYCSRCLQKDPYRCSFGYTYRCSNPSCRVNISPLVGTIYENSKLPLSTWLIIEYAFLEDPHFNQSKLARDIGITQATVNKIVQKLRDKSYNSITSPLMMKVIIFE